VIFFTAPPPPPPLRRAGPFKAAEKADNVAAKRDPAVQRAVSADTALYVSRSLFIYY